MDHRTVIRYALYALFTASGFAGLIYESIWTHYLKLFLGHAAYAQTLVLAIFMGGMALGAWLAAGWSRRLARPLLWYAAIEALLGGAALAFDPAFRLVQDWALHHAFPALGAPAAIEALKWFLSVLMILPQCVLLGATFPLMSAGVVRLSPGIPGGVLAWLYFTNSFGASVGVLASGFYLIARVGLPGTLLTAGVINILLALAVYRLDRLAGGPAAEPAAARGPAAAPPMLLLAAAFLTGCASFFYEIGWIRMLSLVLSSATHSFELMLSAFILGLALGSYWIRGRIDTLAHPVRTLGWIQLVMALLALASLPLYNLSFDWMSAALGALQRNDAGYVGFNLFSHALCLALMLPVTICAGMTLPLITAILMRAGGGEAAIGRVYAWNTLGAITGVLAAVHLVMPLLGLRQVIVVGAGIDFALGAWLLWKAPLPATWRHLAPAALAALAALAIVVTVPLDTAKLASGVFRTGEARNNGGILYYADGKTASISVTRFPDGYVSVASNGKPDASLRVETPTSDDLTQVLIAAIPLMMHAAPRDVAIIGFGSGRSTHAALADTRLGQVDTIEIEPRMVEAARQFGGLVQRAFDDPRSRVHIEDARTFFARHQRTYDAILSEPSNPWVSGNANLFSEEFYAHIRTFLKPGGLLLQWLHYYELSLPLVASVMNALGQQFEDYVVYDLGADLLIVAGAEVPALSEAAFAALSPELRELLAFVRVHRAADVALREVGRKAALAPYFATTGAPANSDYFPILDQNAARDRFLRTQVAEIQAIQAVALRLDPVRLRGAGFAEEAQDAAMFRSGQGARIGAYLAWQAGRGPEPPAVEENIAGILTILAATRQRCVPGLLDTVWLEEFQDFGLSMLPFFEPATALAFIEHLRSGPCHAAAAPAVRHWLNLVGAAMAGDDPAVIREGEALLATVPPDAKVPELLAREMLIASARSEGIPAALERLASWRGRLPKSAQLDYLYTLLATAG